LQTCACALGDRDLSANTMTRLHAALLLFSSVSLPVFAVLPPMSPEQKAASAEAIITGKVSTAYIEIDGAAAHSVYRIRLQASIDEVEKGKGLLKPSDTITIQCWRLRASQAGWAGPSGHHDIPGEGSTFRASMTQNDDGVWEPLAPNGFELTNGSEGLSFVSAEKSMHKGFLMFTVVGVALILGIFLFASRGRRS